MKTKERILLYSNEPDLIYGSYEDFRKVYEEDCKLNDIQPIEDGEFEWFSEFEDNNNWDFFTTQIEEIKGVFLAVGYCGTWRGSKGAGIVSNDLMDLITTLCDCVDIVSIYLNPDGSIHFEGAHHDGTDIFTIYQLNKKGVVIAEHHKEEWKERELHEKLNNNNYCKQIRL